MAWSIAQKTLNDGSGTAFLLDVLTDGTNTLELGAIYDAVNGNLGVINAAGRQLVTSSPSSATPLTGAQVVTVSSTVIKSASGLTLPAGATHCYLSVEVNPIRFWNTGDVPTASNGHELGPGTGPIEIDNVALLQMIRVTADATIQISYHKY